MTLTLGLWPFRSPENEVSWLGNQNGVQFGRHGTVISSRCFRTAYIPTAGTGDLREHEATLEIWLQPRRIWDSGSFLAFYNPGEPFQFTLCQSQLDLEVRTHHTPISNSRLSIQGVFSKPGDVFITVTSGTHGAWFYVNGFLRTIVPQFALSSVDFTSRVVLGDSPGQGDPWPGQMFGFAVYDRQFTSNEVLNNYAAWKNHGHPETAVDKSARAMYLFAEHAGSIVHDISGSGADLYIPPNYQVIDKVFLEPFWREFSMTWSYWGAVLKNIVGFIPFGLCFYPLLLTLRFDRRAGLPTVLLGTSTSLIIELLQYFLPTRESGTTDLITNTMGTWVGVMSYRFLAAILMRYSVHLPLPEARD